MINHNGYVIKPGLVGDWLIGIAVSGNRWSSTEVVSWFACARSEERARMAIDQLVGWCSRADECSICRRTHGLEIIHACE